MASKRTKATSISQSVKEIVWERDNRCCIFCGMPLPMSMACVHFISRANGGLGIKENIVTGCMDCHRKLDQSINRKSMTNFVRQYLDKFYPLFDDDKRIYKKGM